MARGPIEHDRVVLLPMWMRTRWNARGWEMKPEREAQDYYEEEYCPDCGGDGWVDGDCFEDTCCCADPVASHGVVKCPTCGGRG